MNRLGDWAGAIARVALVAFATAAALAAPPADFAAKQYADYLTAVDVELGNRTPEWLDGHVAVLSGVAIAIDRTQAWDRPVAAKVAAYLQPAPNAARYFKALRALLGGDIAAVDRFFDGTPPRVEAWAALPALLSEHGYGSAAAAVSAYGALAGGGMPGMPDDRLLELAAKALLELPAADRERLLAVLSPRLAGIRQRAMFLAMTAFGAAMKSEPAQADVYAQLCLMLQPDSAASAMSSAERLAGAHKDDAAIRLVMAALRTKPARPDGLLRALLFIGLRGRDEAAEKLFATALACWAPPTVRPVRVAWLRWLASAKPDQAAPRAEAASPLAQADLLAIRKQPSGAAYAALVRDVTLPVPVRVDAWAGWVEAEPLAALPAVVELPLTAQDTILLRFAFDAVWRRIGSALAGGLPPGVSPDPLRQAKRDAAALATQALLSIAPGASWLAPPGAKPLRIEAATLLALGGRVDEAIGIVAAIPAAEFAAAQAEIVRCLSAGGAPKEVTSRLEALKPPM